MPPWRSMRKTGITTRGRGGGRRALGSWLWAWGLGSRLWALGSGLSTLGSLLWGRGPCRKPKAQGLQPSVLGGATLAMHAADQWPEITASFAYFTMHTNS